jgi:hypothetical protein
MPASDAHTVWRDFGSFSGAHLLPQVSIESVRLISLDHSFKFAMQLNSSKLALD